MLYVSEPNEEYVDLKESFVNALMFSKYTTFLSFFVA